MEKEIARLQKRWQDEARFRGLHAGMCLEREGVVLGAKTVLVKRLSDGSLESADARVLALLSVAYGAPVDPSVVGAIRRASKHASAGDECMASMHIALARLPRMAYPSDAARRLFIADGLMECGVTPRDVWTALEFDPAPLNALEKYNENEARVPAGSGRPSGEWTSGSADSEAAEIAETFEETTPKVASLVARIGATLETISSWATLITRIGAGPATFIAAMLYAPSGEGRRVEGAVPGRPDLRYSWNGDETELDITQVSNGQVVMRATLGPDGKFRNSGRVIAHETQEGVLVDAAALPSGQPESRSENDTDEPRLCPEPPVPDKPGLTGKRGARSRAYEDFMRLRINPLHTTPERFTYALPNLQAAGRLVFFDDCQQKPGMINDDGTINLPGSMIEFKGLGYARFINSKSPSGDRIRSNLAAQWLGQAGRQVEASQGRPVIWYFAETEALEFARKAFGDSDGGRLRNIQLKLGFWPDAAKWKKILMEFELYG